MPKNKHTNSGKSKQKEKKKLFVLVGRRSTPKTPKQKNDNKKCTGRPEGLEKRKRKKEWARGAHLTTRPALAAGGLGTSCSGSALKPSKSSSKSSPSPPCREASDRNITTGPWGTHTGVTQGV